MSTKYPYSIQSDFPNHKVNLGRLGQEIRASAIVVALDYINTSGDDCDCWFKWSISSGDKAILDGLVAAHSGEPLVSDAPVSSDGKPIVLPCLFPPGVFMYFAGCGDDVLLGRGQGPEFALCSSTQGDTYKDFSFNDYVLLAGGDGKSINAEKGDWVTFEVLAPATQVTVNPQNTGNVNLVALAPGANVIIPAPNGDGTHDLDMTKAVPVPAGKPNEKTGYWEWDWPDTGSGNVTAGLPGQSEFNLYDFPMVLNRQVAKFQLVDARGFELTVPAVNPSAFLPHWVGRCTIHNQAGHADLCVVWTLVVARYKTV